MNLAPTSDKEFIQQLTKIVEANLGDENFGVGELAREAGMSRSQVSRRLKSISNKTVNQFIREVRLQIAKVILQQNKATVSEVAFQVGFSSDTYFSRCFHEFFGYPPGEVRKRESFIEDSNYNNTETETGDQLKFSGKKASVHTQNKYFKFRNVSIGVAGILVLVIILYLVFPQYFRKIEHKTVDSGKVIKSLAILPVSNFTGKPEHDYIADGLHDALITELGKFDNLIVKSRTSTMRFRDSQLSVQQIASELDADLIIEASVICADDSLCAVFQLIEPFPKERHVWSDSYAQDWGSIMTMYNKITQNIAGALKIQLTREWQKSVAASRKVNPEFYKKYWLGMYKIKKSTPVDFIEGVKYLKEAMDIDPLDPLPYIGLAIGYSNAGHASAAGPDASRLALSYARKALELDSTIAEAYVIMGTHYLYKEWDFEKAEKALIHAIRLNPNIAPARYHYSWYLELAMKWDEAVKEMKRAVDIDPLDPICPGYLGWLYLGMEKNEEAILAAQRTMELDPRYTMAYYVMGHAYTQSGRYKEAIEIHKKGVAISPDFLCGLGMAYARAGQKDKALEIASQLEKNPNPWNAWGLTEIYGSLKDKDNTFQWLESMYQQRQDYVPWMKIDPTLRFLFKDKQFLDYFRRLKLP